MKRYKFIIGDNVMYNATHLRRVTLLNCLVVSYGLTDVISWSGLADSKEEAENLAMTHFKKKGMTRQIMGIEY